MKPRIGVYLSEQMAARLAAAAKRPGASKSALVEAALAQFFGSDDEADNLPVDRRLSLMSRQLEQLDRDLRVVNESCRAAGSIPACGDAAAAGSSSAGRVRARVGAVR